MHEKKLFVMLIAATLAIAFGLGDGASAAKKLTYEQAYAKCKSVMDKARVSGHTERYTVGAGCMKKYGYRL